MNAIDRKILVVDDNPINLKLLGRTLTNSNFKVVAALSGREAIELAENENPDMILLDVLMPEMDGYEVCKILKENKKTKRIPVIFLSAKNETVDKTKGLILGAVDYLTKPFDPVEIITRIRAQFSLQKEIVELQQKNEQLKNELTKLQSSIVAKSEPDFNQIKDLQKLQLLNYREANKYFQITARVKFKHPPVTTVFIPVYFDNQNYIYMISGGFKKDYKTSFVHLLLEKYVTGFFYGFTEKNFQEKDFIKLFNNVLEKFSPDIYDTAFTLSLGYVSATKGEFTYLSIHQNSPLVLNNENMVSKHDFRPLFFESKYASIIKAGKLKLPSKATLLNYITGKELTAPEDIKKFCLPAFSENNKDVADSLEKVLNNLPEKDEDQLVMAIRLL